MSRVSRDPLVDAVCVVIAAAGGLVLLLANPGTRGAGWIHERAALAFGVDAALGAIACGMLCFRRRWPTWVAVAIAVPAVLSRSAQLASLMSLFGLLLRRGPRAGLPVAALHQLAFIGFALLWVPYPLWAASLWVLTYHIAVIAIALYLRARRQLIASLHERVAHAEATQKLLADQARTAERARIATEMHDVLAHRVSLIVLHAGALEVRPDLAPDEVRQAAGLIRTTARQALTELRGVIGVLRDNDGDSATHTDTDGVPLAPQPTLGDISTLVSEYQRAGLNVTLDMRVTSADDAPGTLGRDTYRIVREGLTNVSKHASGTAATVTVSGGPGQGLQVMVRNRLPLGQHDGNGLPGSGLGLVGLIERVALAGGTIRHGPDPAGDFVLTAALRWTESAC
ncbi:MAG TPA: histidine kinase [Streptosporangiaceae bacterium]|nr:histidine kinase [Streptosporangiaceae bacterium]